MSASEYTTKECIDNDGESQNRRLALILEVGSRVVKYNRTFVRYGVTYVNLIVI